MTSIQTFSLRQWRLPQWMCLSDKAKLHISGKVDYHNCCIWGSQNPHDVKEHKIQHVVWINQCRSDQTILLPWRWQWGVVYLMCQRTMLCHRYQQQMECHTSEHIPLRISMMWISWGGSILWPLTSNPPRLSSAVIRQKDIMDITKSTISLISVIRTDAVVSITAEVLRDAWIYKISLWCLTWDVKLN
jgi:hypothetical protein